MSLLLVSNEQLQVLLRKLFLVLVLISSRDLLQKKERKEISKCVLEAIKDVAITDKIFLFSNFWVILDIF